MLLLREALPEYEINPHMRLANVVKGKIPYNRALGQYELDFVVQDRATGVVICAIELDDSTHDTPDGRRRDANKNRWMAQAKVRLIRIRHPEEAATIRERFNQLVDFNIPEEVVYAFEKRPRPGNGEKFIHSAVTFIIFVALLMWGVPAAIKGITNNFVNNVQAQQRQFQQRQLQLNADRLAGDRLQQQQEMEQAEARRRVDAQQPHYERVFVKGKSARECSSGNVIDNASVMCMQDHYETVLVGGTR